MRRWILLGLTIVLSLVLVLTFAYPHLMVSAGPLTRAHVELTTDCFACHVPLRGAPSERCIARHSVPDIGLRSTKGEALEKPAVKTSFHQDLIEASCIECHGEHRGLQLNRRGQKTFSHELLRTTSRVAVALATLHPMTISIRTSASIVRSATVNKGGSPRRSSTTRFFVLDRHHDVACKTCHINLDYNRYTCLGCHAHRQNAIRAEHLEEGIRDIDDCVKCHRSASEATHGSDLATDTSATESGGIDGLLENSWV